MALLTALILFSAVTTLSGITLVVKSIFRFFRNRREVRFLRQRLKGAW